MKLATTLALAVGMIGSASAFAMSSSPKADDIGEFQSSWAGKAAAMQRDLDLHEPITKNNILGTHNSYNSRAYRTATRYIDPQQKHSIYDQLRLGARFVELDAHWTYKINGLDWGNEILLCHSGIGKNFGDVHVGCSLSDRKLTEGLQEVRQFLDENPSEVIMLFIEDHVDGEYGKLWNALNSKLGGKMYASGGCKNMPKDLSRADVLEAGKQIILRKDGACAGNTSLGNTAFTDFGGLNRIWEDATSVKKISDFFTGGEVKKVTSENVVEVFKKGGFIVNFDNMTHDDPRNAAAVWSWDVDQPNDWNGQDCGFQGENGRWGDEDCNGNYFFACENTEDGSWQLSNTTGAWTSGDSACAALGNSYEFSVPTSSKDNQDLKAIKNGNGKVWLNYNDRQVEGNWQTPKGKGIFRELRDGRSGLCLDIKGGKSVDGANVQVHSCHGGQNQKWVYDASTGLLRNAMGKCLDISGNDSNVRNSQSIQLWGCSTSAKDQTWDFSGGVLRNRVNTNIVMDAFGDYSGADAALYSYHGGSNQKWNWGN
jgi:hypothetical protein